MNHDGGGCCDGGEKQKTLPEEGQLVLARDIAGARSVSRYHRTRVREITSRLA